LKDNKMNNERKHKKGRERRTKRYRNQKDHRSRIKNNGERGTEKKKRKKRKKERKKKKARAFWTLRQKNFFLQIPTFEGQGTSPSHYPPFFTLWDPCLETQEGIFWWEPHSQNLFFGLSRLKNVKDIGKKKKKKERKKEGEENRRRVNGGGLDSPL